MKEKNISNIKHLTINDICNHMLSECNGYKPAKRRSFVQDVQEDSFLKSDARYELLDKQRLKKPQEEDDYFDELEQKQQEEWDDQQEYENRLHEIHEMYPHFDADEAAFLKVDPEEAERKARIDDYLNNWS